MQAVSTPVTEQPLGGSAVSVFDSFFGGKRLVTAVFQTPEGNRHLMRLAKETRDLAMAHANSFGTRCAVHLVQVFDRDAVRARVSDMLANAKPGALVIFVGRTAEECRVLVEALSVRLVMASPALFQ